MKIESIKLENFRNYESLFLSFHEGTNLFYGDNAQGKTNILESVYLCGTTKSHRDSRDREIIKLDQEESHIRMILSKHEISYQIDMHLKRNKAKGIAINGIPIRRASELIGLGNFIFFSPEDLNIIKNGPSERRRFLDMELCQLNRIYVHNLTNYNRILMQRNRLLKDISFHPEYEDMLDIWDRQMVEYGCQVIRSRDEFVKQLNEIIYEIHKKLSGDREDLKLSYEKNVSEQEFDRQLRKSRERDVKLKVSHTGPHRDDLVFNIKNIDLRKYGSQGQQRTTALSLKLAEILDDVLSELDGNRQRYLLESINDVQTLITCTGVEDFVKNHFQIDRLYHVKNGIVTRQEI